MTAAPVRVTPGSGASTAARTLPGMSQLSQFAAPIPAAPVALAEDYARRTALATERTAKIVTAWAVATVSLLALGFLLGVVALLAR